MAKRKLTGDPSDGSTTPLAENTSIFNDHVRPNAPQLDPESDDASGDDLPLHMMLRLIAFALQHRVTKSVNSGAVETAYHWAASNAIEKEVYTPYRASILQSLINEAAAEAWSVSSRTLPNNPDHSAAPVFLLLCHAAKIKFAADSQPWQSLFLSPDCLVPQPDIRKTIVDGAPSAMSFDDFLNLVRTAVDPLIRSGELTYSESND